MPPLRAQLAEVVSTPSERRRHPDAKRARRVGSIVTALLLVGQDQTQAHSSSSTRRSSTTPDDGSHIHRIVRPRCRTESSWLRAGRVWACTRPLHSVYAAAELVCRRRATAAVGRVILLYNRVAYKSFINTSYLNLCVQPLALTILKLGMIEVDVSNRS